MARRKRSFAVIGLGRFGSKIARELVAYGNHVIGVDVDERLVGAIADDITEAVIADARDEGALHEAGLASYDAAILAIGSDLEASILCHMNLKSIGISDITIKAFDSQHRRIMEALGADDIVIPEEDAGEHIAQRLHNPLIEDFMEICEGSYVALVEPQKAYLRKTLQDLNVDGNLEVECLGIMRHSLFINPTSHQEELLVPGDRLLVQGSRSAIRNFADAR
ncbi:potassium channel family protein [Parasphingorhabdus cellanae]|uniref:TrkA family potassium uptake protein n=1 Tax=Parasphingorhabdus cellanae TaxID=2806553 RepID=A0ABX7T7D4_9SPHN|nr:TrkA family potassium uptake protein [Parasphingorhabdus cellanae]QTD57520.1 TrkA family potassium uptake protein [Parasphingorhabdus cellanae]